MINLEQTIDSDTPLEDHTPAGRNGLLFKRKYSVPEAAKLLGMGETNLRALIQYGEIPALRMTKSKIMILESDLETFLLSRYGTITQVKVSIKQPVLPDHVKNSKYFRT